MFHAAGRSHVTEKVNGKKVFASFFKKKRFLALSYAPWLPRSRKRFFFEKKNQKTFCCFVLAAPILSL
jgi:hypothetical protein